MKRGNPSSRVYRGSLHQQYQPPHRREVSSYHTRDLRIKISNDGVADSERAAAWAERRVVDEHLTGASGGGDFTRHPKPATTSASKNQLAPSVAQLFTLASPNKCSVRDDISELVSVHPQGIELSNFCSVYERCFHRPFDSRWSDVSSLHQMLKSMVDLVECIEQGGEVIVMQKQDSDKFQGNALQL